MREDKGLKKHTENQVSTHILGPPPPTETHTKVLMRSKQAVSCSYTEYNKNANEHNLKKNSRNIIFIYLYKLKKNCTVTTREVLKKKQKKKRIIFHWK